MVPSLLLSRYISRANPRDNTRHVVLSTTSVRPTDFAAQLNVSLANGWGIVRTVTDLCMKMPEGKYVLIKDPNKVRKLPHRLAVFSVTCLPLIIYPSTPLLGRTLTLIYLLLFFTARDSLVCRTHDRFHRRGR